ncbi:MAG: hypothetical protein V4726_24430 [Verrucomicrobiota bacterium]
MSRIHYPIDVQPYDRAKHGATVLSWPSIATGETAPPALMPPVGVVGIDGEGPCCACWLHLSMNVGVCMADNPVTRPDLTPDQAEAAALLMLEALKHVALAHDYGVMTIRAGAAFAAVLQRGGFHIQERPLFTGTILLR